jgi:hypothetical protein
MTNPSPPTPPWAWWHESSRRPGVGPDMRVSDAERAAVGDTLSKHYADGRLDDGEFKERLDRAMSAKTRSDLSGLTTDLPTLQPPTPQPVPRRHPWHVVGIVLVAALVISAVSSVFAVPHVPWLLVAVVALLLWRRLSRRSRYRCHHHSHAAPPPYA